MKSEPSSSGSALSVAIVGVLAIACCSGPLILAALASGALPLLFASNQTLLAVIGAMAVVVLWVWFATRRRERSSISLLRDAFRSAFTTPALTRSALLMAVIGVPLTVFYLVALPAQRFGALSWGALQFLTPGEALSSVLLGLGAPAGIALNLAAHKLRPAQATLTVGGVVAALLPASLCCTTLVPSVLAALGASTPVIMHTSGRYQGFFAQYASGFIGFAVATVLLSVWLAASNLAGPATCAVRTKE